jgi:hypothetical protein
MPLPERREDWPAAALELFEERAAILEYDAGLSRVEAERLAEALIRRDHLFSCTRAKSTGSS